MRTEETIMPDGRPLFAWQNEITMLRADKIASEKRDRENVIFRESMGLIYEHWNDPATLEWNLRIKAVDIITADNFYQALKKYLYIV